MTEPLRLYTFSVSHFSEKIRWTLGLEGIPFVEIPWAPPFHVLEARRSGPGTTVPVIESGGVRVQDSTRILHWLDGNRGPLTLLPKNEDARREALEIEDRFDEVGRHVMRLGYAHVLPDAEAVVRLWTLDATPMQRRVLRASFPVVRALFRRRLDVSRDRIERSREAVEDALRFLEERTASRRYLVGDALSIADVTAASLLAPLVGPEEHPVYSAALFRAGIADVIAPWRSRAAFAWVRGMYRDHRGPWPRAAEVIAAFAAQEA